MIVQKYQSPSLVQLAPEVYLSAGVVPSIEDSSRVPHGTLKKLDCLFFWLSLPVGSTAMFQEVFATLKSPITWMHAAELGIGYHLSLAQST